MRYTKANPYNMINVWVDPKKREDIIKHKLLTDKSFKLTSLQVNPLYKPVFDKLDAQALKILTELDKSVLWSRQYTKADFKHTFLYPLVIFVVIIFGCLNYGVKYRLYTQHIKHGRVLGLSEKMELNLEDVENYPRSVFEFYKEKKQYDAHIKRKEENIVKVEKHFHTFASARVDKLSERRKKLGLRSRPTPA